jgi:hypothetical protein
MAYERALVELGDERIADEFVRRLRAEPRPWNGLPPDAA